MSNEEPNNSAEVGKPLPHCRALLICEKVTESQLTEKITLHNLIEKFSLRSFPGRSTPFVIFIQLYDGIGRYKLTIEVHDLSDDSMVARTTYGNLEFPERLTRMVVTIPIDFVQLPRPGRYELVALANGQEIGRQYFDFEVERE